MVPTVHPDGTPKADLLRQLQAARDALNEAVRLLALACPHVRDYRHAHRRAMRGHRARLDKLLDVLGKLDELIAGIQAQPDHNEPETANTGE